jgi:hypothetical protein
VGTQARRRDGLLGAQLLLPLRQPGRCVLCCVYVCTMMWMGGWRDRLINRSKGRSIDASVTVRPSVRGLLIPFCTSLLNPLYNHTTALMEVDERFGTVDGPAAYDHCRYVLPFFLSFFLYPNE